MEIDFKESGIYEGITIWKRASWFSYNSPLSFIFDPDYTIMQTFKLLFSGIFFSRLSNHIVCRRSV